MVALRHPALRLPEVHPEAAQLYLAELGIIQVRAHVWVRKTFRNCYKYVLWLMATYFVREHVPFLN